MVSGGQGGRPEGAHLLLPHAPCCCCSCCCCCELVLFTSLLLTRGEREREEGEERGGGGGRRGGGGLAQRRCPVSLLSRLQQTQEWLREKRAQGRSPARTCSSSSLTISISRVSVSIQQPPRRSAMSLSGAQTPEDGLYGECCCCCWWWWWWCRDQAAVASDLLCLPSRPWRRCFVVRSHAAAKLLTSVRAAMCVYVCVCMCVHIVSFYFEN